MSVVIPITIAVFLYGDPMPLLKVLGIIMALTGVYLTSIKKEQINLDKRYIYLPLFLFLGSGFLDSVMKYTETYLLDEGEKLHQLLMYVSTLFLIAALLGGLFLIIRNLAGKGFPIQSKSMIGGIILGIPNFFSIYFLMRTLEVDHFNSSWVFPINNMGIVAASAIGGVVIFNEKLSLINKVGIVLSILAIGIIAVS
ncbi:MAG: hypothetical protein ABEH43_02400 [Flavobacteriales bacterium]